MLDFDKEKLAHWSKLELVWSIRYGFMEISKNNVVNLAIFNENLKLPGEFLFKWLDINAYL